MSTLPSGTVTFLFTDIEGSTALWERQPQAMREALSRHDTILREAIDTHAGRVFRTAGDAFFAAFDAAPQAICAAIQAQDNLFKSSWPTASPIRVRMAIHTGFAEVENGDYVGASLNRIGRLIGAGHGGQTLLTQAVEQLVRDSLPAGAHLVDLGEHRFRDLVNQDRIFQLAIPGLPEFFPPLKTLSSAPNNLPLQLTSFIGRERELTEIGSLLSSTRLLTLTGPGGTGKTRLAVQLAAGSVDSYSDGAWLVELAPLMDPALVPQTIAGALNLRDLSADTLMDQLTNALRQKHLLLVLDNCEHLVEACAQIAEHLLRLCPDLRILASSREALGISGEVSYRVPPLRLPDGQNAGDIAEIGKAEAVCLFVKRAQASNPNFTLVPQNAGAVVQICRRLDGIPLALELAAARVKLFSAEQIAAHLDDRFRLLTGGSRFALPRQQTLQAAIDWSYDLLSEKEKLLFHRLSVFSGGWSYEAAEAVCAGEEIDAFELMDLLAQLINKSLVQVDDQGEEARYRYLETVRQYANEKLAAAGEAAEMRSCHLAYFADKSVQIGKIGLFFSTRDSKEYRWLDREQDNLRLAEEWAAEHDPARALQLSTLFPFWLLQGASGEKLKYLRRVRERMESNPEFAVGVTPSRQELLALSWSAEGYLIMSQGYYGRAAAALEQALEISRPIHVDKLMESILGQLSVAYSLMGEQEKAIATSQEGLALVRRLDDREQLGLILTAQGRAAFKLHGYSTAMQVFEQALQEFEGNKDQYARAWVRMGQGVIAVQAGMYADAIRFAEEGYRLFEQNNNLQFLNVARSTLADVARLTGDDARAAHLYLDAITDWLVVGNRGAIARCLECLAAISFHQSANSPDGKDLCKRAASLFGAAEAIRAAFGSEMSPEEKPEYASWIESLRGLMEEGEFAFAWSIGSGMNLERAVDFARRPA